MAKVIFLDIDGVMIPEEFENLLFIKQAVNNIRNKDRYGSLYSPEAVANLKSIIDATGAYIVINSLRRLHTSLSDFQDIWKGRGLPGYVLGITPDSDSKGLSAQMWLEECDWNITSYVIIDDFDDMLPSQNGHYIVVDPLTGLTEEVAKKAIDILKEQNPM